jgi:hypothetical protein
MLYIVFYYWWRMYNCCYLLCGEEGTLYVERLESQIILNVLWASKPNGLNRIAKSTEVTYPWGRITLVLCLFVCLMVLNATFNNISVILWRSDLLVEESGGPGENHDLSQVTDKLYHIMLYSSSWSRFEFTTHVVIVGTDWVGSCKCNYHTITATTAPHLSFNNNLLVRNLLQIPKTNILINQVSAETLTNERMIPSGTNSPAAEVSSQW